MFQMTINYATFFLKSHHSHATLVGKLPIFHIKILCKFSNYSLSYYISFLLFSFIINHFYNS